MSNCKAALLTNIRELPRQVRLWRIQGREENAERGVRIYRESVRKLRNMGVEVEARL